MGIRSQKNVGAMVEKFHGTHRLPVQVSAVAHEGKVHRIRGQTEST